MLAIMYNEHPILSLMSPSLFCRSYLWVGRKLCLQNCGNWHESIASMELYMPSYGIWQLFQYYTYAALIGTINALSTVVPHKVKTRYVHFRSYAEHFLLPWKIPEEMSRQSMLLSITKGNICHIKHMSIHPFTMGVEWPEIGH